MKDFIAASKKAVAGGIAAGATALAGSLAPAIADGVFTTGEFWTVATFTLGGFAIGFAGVYAAPKNRQ